MNTPSKPQQRCVHRLRLWLWLCAALLAPAAVLACGTLQNWMDVYEGVGSNHEWRDSMNRLEALVMMNGCGGSALIGTADQQRLRRILDDARARKLVHSRLPASNRDIAAEVRPYRYNLHAYEGLLLDIYRKYRCLPETAEGGVFTQTACTTAGHKEETP